jgi:deoxyinosine 3'endonuclease (endonuclease V)
MGLLRKVAFVGIAKKLYDESRKPENQRRINEAMASLKARRDRSRGHG